MNKKKSVRELNLNNVYYKNKISIANFIHPVLIEEAGQVQAKDGPALYYHDNPHVQAAENTDNYYFLQLKCFIQGPIRF